MVALSTEKVKLITADVMTVNRINDRGFRNMRRNLRNLDRGRIEAGIFKESIAQRSAIRGSRANFLAYRYSIHDQGLGNNPQRETLNPSFQNSLRRDPIVRTFLASNLDSIRGVNNNIRRVQLRLASGIKKGITALRSPAKTQQTIRAAQRRYGGGARGNPLIQTGEMRRAVNARYVS